MSLEVIEIRDLRDFTKDYIDAVVERDLPGASFASDTSTGWNMAWGDGETPDTDPWYSVYHHIRDEIIGITIGSKKLVDNITIALRAAIHSRDALCRNPSVGWYREGDTLFGGNSTFATHLRLKIGQPNLQTGEQKLYARSVALGGHVEIDASSGSLVGGLIWPNIPNDFVGSTVSDTNIDTAGEWRVTTGANPEQRSYNPVIFEGITSSAGYVGETSPSAGILRGGNSHPSGLALISADATNFVGGGSGNAVGERWIWVDLATGLAVGVLGLPTRVDSGSTNVFHEPSIDGRTFDWRIAQFVPDPGSTFAQPKGEIHLSTALADTFVLPGQSVVAPEQTFTSTVVRNYVAVHDFNPFNVASGTVRVHNRRRFLGKVDVPQQPIISGGFNATNSGSTDRRNVTMIYHPPSRTYIVTAGHPANSNNNEADAPAVGNSRIIRFRRAVVVDNISKPTPTTEVNENRTIKLRTVVSTDLGDRSSGVTVSFDHYRLSTRAETFNGTTQAATPYVVAAAEIDDDGHLDVRQGASVDGAGTPLVQGVDFTVNFGTGTLTPASSWPSASIYVRYRHRGVRRTPAHGTLLSSSAVTDANGNAYALVRYGDNLDGEIDGLEATA